MEVQINNEDFPESSSTIVRIVSSVLEKLIIRNDSTKSNLNDKHTNFAKFQSSSIPDVSIEPYLERLRRYSRCSDACFVMSLVYVDKLIESKNLILTSLNVHRLLVTCVMVAAKFHDDLFYNNAYFSKLGGISLQELNLLEVDLLSLLSYSLFVNVKSYDKYSLQLKNYIFYLDVAVPNVVPYEHYSTVKPLIPSPCKMPQPSSAANNIPSSSRFVDNARYSYDQTQLLSPNTISSVEHTLQGGTNGQQFSSSSVNLIQPPLLHINPCHPRIDISKEWYNTKQQQQPSIANCSNIYEPIIVHQTPQFNSNVASTSLQRTISASNSNARFLPDSSQVFYTKGVEVDNSVPFSYYYSMQQPDVMKERQGLLLKPAGHLHPCDMHNERAIPPVFTHNHQCSSGPSNYHYHLHQEEQKKRTTFHTGLVHRDTASYPHNQVHHSQMIHGSGVVPMHHSPPPATTTYVYHNNLITVSPPCTDSLSTHQSKYSNYHKNEYNSSNHRTNIVNHNININNNNSRVSYPSMSFDYTSASIQKGSIAAKYAHLMMFGSPISLNSL